MQYFKVVDNINSEVTIDTNKTNYSLILVNKDKYSDLLDFVTQSSSELDLPLDFYFSLNNNIYLSGNAFLQRLPKSINRVFEVDILTGNSKHRGIYIKESDLIGIIESLDKIGFELFQEGFYLWENIYEKVRTDSYRDKPSREKSFFLFDNLKDCQYYINNHKCGGQICEVEILEKRSLFKADMNLLDIIPSNYTFKQTKEQVEKYWSGKTSNKIVNEYLFQGICKLKPL
ncbi:MAG: hypothetical protein WD048_08935 [Chitinophagales bacterium]